MERKLCIMLAGLCLLMSCRAPANKEEYQLQDYTAFVFEGKPINPKIIERFLPWESDLYPSVLVVDLSSANSSNEFSSNFVEKGKGLFSYKSADGKIFGYKTIGKLSNGTFLLKAFRRTEGSGTFRSVLFLNFQKKAMSYEGKTLERTLLVLMKFRSIDSKGNVTFSIKGNEVYMINSQKRAVRL